MRKLLAACVTLALILTFALTVGRANDRDEAVMTVQVTSADHELQEVLKIAVYDLVSRCHAVLVLQPHVVLLGFVAREDDDLLRPAHFAAQ